MGKLTISTGPCSMVAFCIPSGKRLHNYGKSPFSIRGKTHYFYGHVLCRFLYVYRAGYIHHISSEIPLNPIESH